MYINTILRTGKNRNKVKETKKNEQHFTFQDFMQTLKKNTTVLSHNLECFKLIPIFFVTVLFEKQYSTIIEHKRYKINRHVSCHKKIL